MAPGTKCDSDTNREEAIKCEDDDWRVRGRGNSPLVKQPLAGGGQTQGSSSPPDGQESQQHNISSPGRSRSQRWMQRRTDMHKTDNKDKTLYRQTINGQETLSKRAANRYLKDSQQVPKGQPTGTYRAANSDLMDSQQAPKGQPTGTYRAANRYL